MLSLVRTHASPGCTTGVPKLLEEREEESRCDGAFQKGGKVDATVSLSRKKISKQHTREPTSGQ